jgi:hypothetical protein
MDLHIYTRELLDKHLLPELKEIAQGLGIIPDGNKTLRETWVAALVGKPFPVFQTIEKSIDGDRALEPTENSIDVDRALEPIENSPGADRALEPVEKSPGVDRALEPVENSPGADRTLEPWDNPPSIERRWGEVGETSPEVEWYWREGGINPPDCDCVQKSIEFPDLDSAIAEIARLRAQNDELLKVVRHAKDISPVEKPSLKRVLALARAACMDISKSLSEGWVLRMGHLKRSFKKLRDIWDLLITDDWHLMDLFSPPSPPVAPKPLFAPIHSRYAAVPFAEDNLIDTWTLGVNAASSGRAPPGGDAM